MTSVLTPEELEACRVAFNNFDTDGSGTIDPAELTSTLKALGQNPTQEEVFQMIADVDTDGSMRIEFGEFLKVIENQKTRLESDSKEADTLDAWIGMEINLNWCKSITVYTALGGHDDKTGTVDADKIRNICKKFELTIDVEELLNEIDADKSGYVEYEEFKAMLS